MAEVFPNGEKGIGTLRSEEEMYRLILDCAQRDPLVRAVVLNGSRANPAAALDRLRDFDIVYLVTDVTPYKQGDISSRFGEILVMERTDESELFGDHLPDCAAYLMQFRDGNRIDLTVARREDWRAYCLEDPLSIVLLDKDGFLPQLPFPNDSAYWVKRPSERMFWECRTEFWWTVPYVQKAVLRNQLSYAQNHLETCTRAMLRLMLSWLCAAEHDFQISFGKYGDSLREYLPKEMWERYRLTYAPFDGEQIMKSLFCACELFSEASAMAAKRLGYSFDGKQDIEVTRFLKTVYPKIAALPREESWEGQMKRQIRNYGGPPFPVPEKNSGREERRPD